MRSSLSPSSSSPYQRLAAVALVAGALAVSMSGAARASKPRALRITQVYTTAETSTSAAVVWNTSVAADSRVQYSTSHPVPASAPSLYSPSQVTYHEFALTGLMPGTLYYFTVTSCAKRECVAATGSFDTYPSCPDSVPPVSGVWEKSVSPNVSAAVDHQLLGIAAVSADDIWAVGWAQDPDAPPYVKRPLTEHFDGNAWSIVPSPYPATDSRTELHAVSAAAWNDVWAVGSTDDGTLPSRTLVQHWDGTRWTIVPSPSPGDQVNALLGVAAISAIDAWAVGYSIGSQTQANIDTLVLRWNGVSWSRVASPNVAGVANQLFGIAAISATDIWAVGAAGAGPLTLHWNGSTWSSVSVQRGGGLSSEYLTGVSGAASHDIWAVGTGRGLFNNRAFATLRHWDGVRWADKVCYAASSSNPPDGYEGGGPDAYYTAISAASSTDVWAVGVRGSGPLIHHWDGLAWTTVTHPRAFPDSATLHAVATVGGGGAWTAGRQVKVDGSGTAYPVQTLIHRYRP